MKAMVWFVALACVTGVVYGVWRMRAKWEERNRASEERFAALMSQTLPNTLGTAKASIPPAPSVAAAPAPIALAPKVSHDAVVQQRLLMEAAAKAGEAGEPALSIQLYAKLLARFPQSSFADPARAAVAAQKKKLAPKP
ncbi:MAG: hypothetical protein QOD26_2472 [Betaproteobacteria bacterium]|jgi:hypothetical protein|nr:hypothetical protein [Betaproteobacteria bacterium]